MTQLRFGPEGVEEPGQGILAPLTPLMKRELFGPAAVADRLQPGGDLVQRLVPCDPFPLALAALADAPQRI